MSTISQELCGPLGNTLIAIIGALLTTVGFLSWRTIARMEEKFDQFINNCHANHEALITKFPSRIEWEAWKLGRGDIKKEQDELWSAFNAHTHNGGGKVVRG